MDTSTVAGLSLIMETNDDVARAAGFLAALGLEVAGEDGFVEVKGSSISLTIMRGAMVDVSPLGGLLLQLAVADVDAATKIAGGNGGAVLRGPETTDWGSYSAYVRGPAGLTVELITAAAD
jgi:predicted enzyme related to lactoylglutathione lyase